MTDLPSTTESIDDLCRLRMGDRRGGAGEMVELLIPSSDYRLLLRLDGDPALLPDAGKRLRGVIRGTALRMHRAVAGGRFIEPVYGHPRIVQGTVMAIDPRRNRMLADVVVPMWLELQADQPVGAFATGDLVNFYVETGLAFTPMG